MEQLDKQPKQDWAGLTSLFGASSCGKPFTKRAINIHPAAHTVIFYTSSD
jgi:hypothetical protein